jgi:hypothetical protein
MSVSQIEKIVAAVMKGYEKRDRKWKARRRIRYRDMDQELRSLPLSTRAGGNTALMIYQTEEPNQEVHRRVKRLVANKERVDVIVYDSDSETKQLAQDIKDSMKALLKWMNRGKIPASRRIVEYQQGDGLGVARLDFLADFADEELMYFDADVLAEEPIEGEHRKQMAARMSYRTEIERLTAVDPDDTEVEAKAYEAATDKARRKCDPPFRLSAVDPLTFYFTMDGDNIDVAIEKGKRKLSALLETMSDNRLRMINGSGDVPRLIVWPENTDAVGSDTIPANDELSGDYGDLVDYVEIRTKKEIVVLISHPDLIRQRAVRKSSKTEDDCVKLVFDNPFGPYSTGYVLVPGDITGSHDPADMFQPSILGTLNVAQAINVLTTIRLSAAIDTALASKHIESKEDTPDAPPPLTQGETDKTPTVKDGKEIAVIPGKLMRAPNANVDLDKGEQTFHAIEASYRFNEVLAGDAQSSDSGHKLAIQVSQADTQLVPYQNARAEATAEILMCCLYAAHKLNKTIYVRETPDRDSLLMNKVDSVMPVRAITPEMFDMDFNLIVTIGSETPVTKFAKWSALESRYKAGTLSFETLMEQSDVENVADETARIFEGQTLVAVMQQAIPVIVQLIAQRAIAKLTGPPPGQQGQVIEQGGNENGGGMAGAEASTPIAGVGRLPGVGLSPGGPTTGDFGGGRVQAGAGDGQQGVG